MGKQTGSKTLGRVLITSASDERISNAVSMMGKFGRIATLVNNAGIWTAVPALREKPQDFRDVLEVNSMDAYCIVQAWLVSWSRARAL